MNYDSKKKKTEKLAINTIIIRRIKNRVNEKKMQNKEREKIAK